MLLIHRKLEFLKLYVEYLKSIAQLYKDGQRKSHIIYFSLWCFISRGLCVFKENLETRSSNLNTNLRKRSDVCKIFKHQSPEKDVTSYMLASQILTTFSRNMGKRVSGRAPSYTCSRVDHCRVWSWCHHFCITSGKLLNLTSLSLFNKMRIILCPYIEDLSRISGMC